MLNTGDRLVVSLFFGDHDSNVTVASRDRVLLHLEVERLLGVKHIAATAEEMDEAVAAGLRYVGADEDAVDEVLVAKWSAKCDLSAPIRIGRRTFTPVITGHHANHLGTALPSGFDHCLVLCADGWSEDGGASMYLYDYGRVDRVAVLDNTFLTGRVYGTATQMTVQPDFMKAHSSDTGKMLGLSAFGRHDSELAARIRGALGDINRAHPGGVDDLLRQFDLSGAYSSMPDERRRHFAATVQKEWEEELLAVAARFRPLSSRLAVVGGCAMNVVANGRLANSGIYSELFIPAMPSDSGQSLGAVWNRYRGTVTSSPYLGRHHGVEATASSVRSIVDDLTAGRVVALYSGAAESGPRALGNRSILAAPSSAEVRVRVSEEIKRRESYRPVAPMIRAEDLSRFFDGSIMSPYMTYAYQARQETIDRAPAVVHVDGTSRVQTVAADQHAHLHAVLTAFEVRGGIPILLNTSMNVAGSPMVDTPDGARRFLKETAVDVVYLGDERLTRS
ncbi:carbamoyltransferase [Pilimelia terevasa]|uniref:Carbamoyltransferase n=1 Tax=Pilimelia terevasa TaxID=53372 RepID=A0A8J3BS70_9ACTN|nr:carbamoyltransferase C-terminal domain-containing protein [Pilimelia terevasa]GGK43413.1 carbamoyltransferase [Pilimelia terevasa]